MSSVVRERIFTQQNAVILTAICFAIPIAYGFHIELGGSAGDFLLLMTLATGIPMAYDGYWPKYSKTWKAIV